MSVPNAPGSVPPPPPPPHEPEAADASADATTAPTQHLPVPPPPEEATAAMAPVPTTVSPAYGTPAGPPPAALRYGARPEAPSASVPPPSVSRVSAAQRMPTTAPSSPYAAAAPQPARPMPRAGIPLQQVHSPEAGAGDWFAAAATAQQQPQQPQPASYAPQGYAQGQGQYAQPYPPSYDQQPQGVAPAVYGQGAYASVPAAQEAYAGVQQAYAGHPAGESASRRRLSGGWIAFILFDVVLIAAAGIFAWNLLSGPSPHMEPVTGQAGGSTAAASPTDSGDDGAAATPTGASLATFAAPSRNIACEITTDAVTCSIAKLNQQPAPIDGCDGTTGYRVMMAAGTGKVTLPCVPASDQPKAAPKNMKPLKYGDSITQGQFTCTSEKSGMQCKDNKSGRGFTVARAGIGTF